jgi:hypothetical protein
VCITVSAPVTFSYAAGGTAEVILSLYRRGSVDAVDSVTLHQITAEGEEYSVTPILVTQQDPGAFYAQLTISGTQPTVAGRINISASVASLAL